MRDRVKSMLRRFTVRNRRTRTGRGTSLTEAVVAAMIFVPVALFILDLAVLVITNSKNDQAAKNAARAAASQPAGNQANSAAQQSISSIKKSSIIQSLVIKDLVYNPGAGSVTCQTRMIVQVPIPFPGFSQFTFIAQAKEPIVGTASK